jgi:hypothetical protein
LKPFWKSKPFQLRWNEPLGDKECPYAYRWVFIFFGYSIRIHKWIRSDDKRYMHNHPWWFLTFILKGSYTDVSNKGEEFLKRFSFRFRLANHSHYVSIPKTGAVTILITGRPKQKWGFNVNGVFKRPLKYFYKFGHPPCSEQ